MNLFRFHKMPLCTAAASLVLLSLAGSRLHRLAAAPANSANIEARSDYADVVHALEPLIEHELKEKAIPSIAVALVEDRFLAERMVNLLDENRFAILSKQHGIQKTKENESIGRLFTASLRRADESTLGRVVVEAVVLLTASRGNASHVLRDAAKVYKGTWPQLRPRSSRNSLPRKKRKRRRKTRPNRPIKGHDKDRKREQRLNSPW